ncbi:hypothetical protein GQF01_08925 [Paenibacillus sp. 5J-6]|uniref:DUF5666 domain-containing protein n=1 Tax=Paenibacillus silvestris TaxID=2606219 RepID=A0A6L8UVJ1_9BACL|nr:hypothetical protein [Paenibacillus silvestris]MZQ82258.1 hypothetical protein [Paenibacillus silvestris]
MRKRLPFIIVSITLVALLVCGWTAYASTSPNSAISTSVGGTFKSTSTDAVTVTTDSGDQTVPLAKSVWVFKNDQKAQLTDLHAGDQIELILNSKQQAAYVKAVSTVPAEPATSPAASATPEPTQSPAATEVPTSSPTPAIPKPEASTKPTQPDKDVYPDLQGIDLNVDGKHFKLHMGQSKDAKGMTYDLSIKPEDSGMIHLKGEEAAQWIQKLLSSIDLKSSDAEQKIAGLLAQHYNLDANKLNVHMKTKWAQQQQQQQQPKQVQKKPDDDHDDKRKDEPKGGPKAKDDHNDERKNDAKPRGNSHHDD